MWWLLACSDQGLNAEKVALDAVDTGSTSDPPDDTAQADSSAPDNLVPRAEITSPEPGVPVNDCDGVTLRGKVGGGDGALAVTWFGNGIAVWTGSPESDGTSSLFWTPATGATTWRLEAADTDGDIGADERSVDWAPPTSEGWDLNAQWERSAMADRVAGASIGSCIGDAIALPTSPAWVWDSGDYTPPGSATEGTAAGRIWASWDQVNSIDCHFFRLTVDVPACGFTAIRLSSPWFLGVPINDNVYIVVDGATIWSGGTTLGGGGGGPAEVDYWMAGTIADLDASLFTVGSNEIDIVTEEYASWGGLGYLEPTLVP